MRSHTSTVDDAEVERFSAMAAEWWDPSRTPLDAIVSDAQKLIRSALLPIAHDCPEWAERTID